MDKKLEARVSRLEKMLVRKNESFHKLTVGELIEYLSQFDSDKEVQFEMGNVLDPIDAANIYDAGDSVNFDFTYIMRETSGW